jgi:tetratricopeptide (TPR) repeat protein
MNFSVIFRNAIRVLLALSVLAAGVQPAAQAQTDSAGVNLLLAKARSLESRDRDDLAAQVWQQVLVTAPNQPEALTALARWAKRHGKNSDANTYLSRLNRVAPSGAALVQLDTVPSNDGEGNARLKEAAKLASIGRYDEAMRLYRAAFGSTPPVGGWSVAYYETLAKTSGGFEPAVAALKELALQYPDVTAYQLSAGKLMTYQPGTRHAGMTMLEAIPEGTALGAKAREAWHEALVWEKSNPAYASELDAYLRHHKDAELETARAGMHIQTNSQLAARATYSPTAHEEQLGFRALNEGNTTEAEKQFEEALNRDSGSGRAHAGLGYVRMKTGDFGDAVKQLETARKTMPNNPTLRSSLDAAKFWEAMHSGAKSADEGNWTEAVTRYETALSLRPHDHVALRALGGALLASGAAAKALPYLSAAVKAQSSDETAWCALMQAKLQAEGGKPTIDAMQSVPEPVKTSLEKNTAWKTVQSAAYSDAGDDERALAIFRELTTSEGGRLTADEELQLASLALHFGRADEALPLARRAVEDAPGKAGAWETLVSALVAAKRAAEAERVYARMPAQAQESAMSHASFLETLASLKEMSGDLEGAAGLLDKSLESPAGLKGALPKDRTAVKLRLAQVLAKMNRGEEARTIIAAITDANPDDVNAWRTELLVLQSLNRQDEIVDAAFRMPPAVALKLGTQGDMVTLLARAQAASGNPQVGVKLLDAYIARAGSSDRDTTAERLQLAWLLLNDPKEGGRLYSLLDRLGARQDLTADQRTEVTNIWATWISRSANAARAAGNPLRATALLEQGFAMFPQNVDLERGLAGDLMALGNMKRAFNIYSNWGLVGAQPDDYAGAITAAVAVHNNNYADAWLEKGLGQWPDNVKLLILAGERAQRHGDIKRAEAYFKEAVAQKRLHGNTLLVAGQAATPQIAGPSSLKSLLIGSAATPADSQAALRPLSKDRGFLASSPDGATPQIQLSSYRTDAVRAAADAGANSVPLLDASGTGLAPVPEGGATNALVNVAPTSDPLDDKLAGLQSRNTPYLGSGMSVSGRGGEPGFSRLLIEQANFEASAILANSLRASFLLMPTYLSGGTATGTGDSLFGRQTTPASFGVQDASGIAAETQLSSNSFGLRLGISPEGFLTHNWVGGLRVQPKSGPIAFVIERDNVKDTMLSYDGARDPVTRQIWGGVMANTASIQTHWGNETSGFYANGAYQTLDGRNVARNTAIIGNAGAWWKIMTLSTGNVTVGLNFSDMHYERNLRYFTFGQGGYFSPQQYFLFNVPVRWSGYYGKRIQYVISASLGSQHFAEDASDYYPTDPALQARTQYVYQAYANTGANFSFDARLNWQVASHYLVGAFVTANNARNYTASSAGLFVKYTFEERPLNLADSAPSVPNWRGQQPFFLQ